MILSHKDILILPFEGQNMRQEVAQNGSSQSQSGVNPARTIQPGKVANAPVRKQVTAPTGKLSTTNIGINDILNPPEKNSASASEELLPKTNEKFTFEALERVWKAYCLEVKRNKKDSLYSTLQSKMTMNSDYQIHLELVNSVQSFEIEKEKVELLGYLRKELNNYSISLVYSIVEAPKTQILDSRGVYERLAEENTSLDKFRKLFNLDIEF